MLVQGLPLDAAVRRNGKQWTTERELAAEVVEHVDYWGHAMTIAACRLSGRDRRRFFESLKKPTSVKHHDRVSSDPGAAEPERMSTRAEISAFFGRLSRKGVGK